MGLKTLVVQCLQMCKQHIIFTNACTGVHDEHNNETRQYHTVTDYILVPWRYNRYWIQLNKYPFYAAASPPSLMLLCILHQWDSSRPSLSSHVPLQIFQLGSDQKEFVVFWVRIFCGIFVEHHLQ